MSLANCLTTCVCWNVHSLETIVSSHNGQTHNYHCGNGCCCDCFTFTVWLSMLVLSVLLLLLPLLDKKQNLSSCCSWQAGFRTFCDFSLNFMLKFTSGVCSLIIQLGCAFLLTQMIFCCFSSFICLCGNVFLSDRAHLRDIFIFSEWQLDVQCVHHCYTQIQH